MVSKKQTIPFSHSLISKLSHSSICKINLCKIRNKIKNQIVLTKCDLLYDDEIAKQYEYLFNQIKVRPFSHTCEEMIVVSSKRMNGIKEIQEEILSFLPEKGAKYRQAKTQRVPLPDVPTIAPPKPLTIKDNSSPQSSSSSTEKRVIHRKSPSPPLKSTTKKSTTRKTNTLHSNHNNNTEKPNNNNRRK